VSVGQACAGLKGLQAMLVGGTLMAYWTLGRVRSGYWWHLPVLLAGAWAANALRVLLTAVGVAWLPPDWVRGDAHLWQGWLLLLLAFVGCGIWMRRWEAAKDLAEPGSSAVASAPRSPNHGG
jgi:exosortase/archaeosortase family protein